MADPLSMTPAGAASIEAWRRLIAPSAEGRGAAAFQTTTRDGIVIEPLYAPRTDTAPLTGRGARPWTIVQIVDDPDAERANAQAREDLDGGAGGLSLRFAGSPSAGGFGIGAASLLEAVLLDVDFASVHVRIEPFPGAASAARRLADLILVNGTAPELASVSFGLDPISIAAFSGQDRGTDLADHPVCFRELRTRGFAGPLATCDARVFHESGASEAQELAAVLAGAVWWMRSLDDAGIAPAVSLPLLGAALAVDCDQLISIAKLRALRTLWARLQEMCAAPQSALPLHAETSRRMMIAADPYTNLLRTTIAAFSAGLGGADSVAVLPHTAALGLPDRSARALARNIQHLLLDESHVHLSGDAAAGSGAVEAMTEALAERAWAEFQRIESEGGILDSLRAGRFQTRVAEARAALRSNFANGRARIVGVTAYRNGDATDHAMPDPLPPDLAPELPPIRLETLAMAAADAPA